MSYTPPPGIPEDTRYYGDHAVGTTTIHGTQHVDVEVDKHGKVVAVWFRCMTLPFEQHDVDEQRAKDMRAITSPPLRAVIYEAP